MKKYEVQVREGDEWQTVSTHITILGASLKWLPLQDKYWNQEFRIVRATRT